jgi:hypothetical protein
MCTCSRLGCNPPDPDCECQDEVRVNRMSDAALLGLLRLRYQPRVIPPCRICGGELSLQEFGSGIPSVWACSTGGKPGRTVADRHYRDSKFTADRSGGDEEVIELIRRFEAK